MSNLITKIIASIFFTGYIKKGGGTVAAIITCIVFYYTKDFFLVFLIITFSLIIGTIVSYKAEEIWGHDSSKIVIDEFAGMALSLFLLPKILWVYVVAFFLFRLFDIFKIFPINKVQMLDGGVGVMADDVLSGIFANLITGIIICIVSRL
ncbi:phosphatidylglycerophosphatase A [candidate division WOR-3 bacterium]|nr:phosphatidylglycerophosphatase A [candidate division WOR-3 bacterium]